MTSSTLGTLAILPPYDSGIDSASEVDRRTIARRIEVGVSFTRVNSMIRVRRKETRNSENAMLRTVRMVRRLFLMQFFQMILKYFTFTSGLRDNPVATATGSEGLP